MTNALLIEPGNDHATLIDVDVSLQNLQKLVGGWLEGFPFLDGQALVNEEGKMSGQPVNELATRMAKAAAAIRPDDEIVGPMLLVSVRPGGATGDVPERLVSAIRDAGIEVRDGE